MKSVARQAEPARIQLFLRIKHPTIDPAEITRALDLQPEHTIQAGPAVSARGVKTIHSESYWLAALPVPSIKDLIGWAARPPEFSVREQSVPSKASALRLAQATGLYDMQMILWLRKLQGHSDFIKQLIDAGGTITLVLQLPDRTAPLSLGPNLSRQLADLQIRLEID